MAGWDEGSVTYSDSINGGVERDDLRSTARDAFLSFFREFRDGPIFIYRDQAKRKYNMKQYWLEVNLDHVSAYQDGLLDLLRNQPAEFMPLFEAAATDVTDQLTRPRPNNEPVHPMQIVITSPEHSVALRELGSSHMSKLVKIGGIITSAAATKTRASRLTIQCRNCKNTKQININAGMTRTSLPRTCDRSAAGPGDERCPLDPYQILPDKSVCDDNQILKLQESPEMVPTGEMPRHMLLSADRYLTDQVIPGTRCEVVGIYSVYGGGKERGNPGAVAIRKPYLRILGIDTASAGAGRSHTTFTPEEESELRELSRQDDIYEKIIGSIAPSIWGSEDIKKAVACLLFGGSTKLLPDQVRLRGDINVLLLGDPGTAKSQMLKFAEQVAPIGVYTSGKGSSAAGLTASVIRDASSREFYLEGGAMVLADGGIVCIDEFDKMRETDRVAIHEAMEQQTISVAKAGITTTLNSRASVLAAANSVFGRWDDSKDTDENVEFQSTILSRFDLIFVVKDEHDEKRDIALARHVMGVHLNALQEPKEGEMDIGLLKKYISYAKNKCGPRLGEDAVEKLKNHFVQIRSVAQKQYLETQKRAAIPITIRQLEAMVRISESLAKMRLAPFATDKDVEEAIRLFKVSTMSAALAGGSEGAADQSTMDEVLKVETLLKRRFPVGSRVSEARIVADFAKQSFPELLVRKVLSIMLRRGELEHQMQRRVLYRIK